MVREGRVLIKPANGRPEFGSGYLVTAYEVGAVVSAGSSGSTIDVCSGHGFAVDDRLIVGTDATRFERVAAIGALSITVEHSFQVAAGEILVNLGTDSGTTGPNFDGSGAAIYTDPDYTSQAIGSTVACNDNGRYVYYHQSIDRWEVVRSGSSVVAVYTDTGNGILHLDETGFDLWLTAGTGSTLGITNLSGGHGPIMNKDSDQPYATQWSFARDLNVTWAIGEDFTVGDRSYFALWSDKGAVSGSSWASGDILGISWGGADSGGLDGAKWNFNGAFSGGNYEQAYQYQFFLPSLRTSGTGMRAAWFGYAHANCTSGGVTISKGGSGSVSLILDQAFASNRYASIQMGTLSGNKLFEIGTDLAQANTQNFSIYDVLNAVYRFYIDPNGLIGIGTQSPDSPIHVYKSQNASTLINISNPSTGTAGRSGIYVGDGGAGSALQLERFSTGFTGDSTLQGDAMVYASGASAMLHFGTAGLKRMTLLNNAAKLGIGVDPPTEALDVVGNSKASGYFIRSVTAAITASTTHTQVGATALTTEVNNVATCANASDAVSLPSAAAGMQVIIFNNGAQALAIWPASGDNAGSGVDTVHASTLAAGSNRRYVTYDSTNWEVA